VRSNHSYLQSPLLLTSISIYHVGFVKVSDVKLVAAASNGCRYKGYHRYWSCISNAFHLTSVRCASSGRHVLSRVSVVACSLETSMRATNGIHLGWPLSYPFTL
jgi:hypothetical protein